MTPCSAPFGVATTSCNGGFPNDSLPHDSARSVGRRLCIRRRIARSGDLGSRRDLSLSDLCEMGRGLQGQDQCRDELPIDRLGRRHQADPEQDGRFRRFRHAAEEGGAG